MVIRWKMSYWVLLNAPMTLILHKGTKVCEEFFERAFFFFFRRYIQIRGILDHKKRRKECEDYDVHVSPSSMSQYCLFAISGYCVY